MRMCPPALADSVLMRIRLPACKWQELKVFLAIFSRNVTGINKEIVFLSKARSRLVWQPEAG